MQSEVLSYGVGILLVTVVSCSNTHEEGQCNSYYTTEFGNSMASEPLFPYLADWVNWESMEDQVPIAQRLQLMDTVYWYNSMYGHTGNPDYTHVLNMNADDAADYVYSGPGPGFDTKEMITIFKINNTVLSVSGTLKSLDFERRVLKKLYVERSVETSSTNVKKQTSYEIDYKDGVPTLRKVFQSEMSDTTELPLFLYERYQLRTFCGDPIIFSPKPQTRNATLSHLTTIKGLVLGEKIDFNNKKWLFVAIAPVAKATESSDSTYQVGWTLLP